MTPVAASDLLLRHLSYRFFGFLGRTPPVKGPLRDPNLREVSALLRLILYTPRDEKHRIRYVRTDAPLFVYSRPGGPSGSNSVDASAGSGEAAICRRGMSSAPALRRHDAQQSG